MSELGIGNTVWPVTGSTFALFGPQTVIGVWQAPADAVGVWLWLISHDDPNGYSSRSFHSSQWTLEKPSDAELAARQQRRAHREAENRALQDWELQEAQAELERISADLVERHRIRVLPPYDHEELPTALRLP